MYINNGILEIDDSIIDIYAQSDIHGNLYATTNKIKQYDIHNALFIICGDCGFGFERLGYYKDLILPKLTKVLKKYNCKIIYLRGNHDNPNYFDGKTINTKYVCTVPDYTIVKCIDKNILCVGGGISIDREWRKYQDLKRLEHYSFYHKCTIKEAKKQMPLSYWENEQVKYQSKINERIDIICSHSAPSFCYPFTKGDIVIRYAENDETLLQDIEIERTTLDKVYEDYKDTITHWYYGHYHSSMMQMINGCMFKLLDIEEICRHVSDYNNFK